jgi:hypothetical protein
MTYGAKPDGVQFNDASFANLSPNISCVSQCAFNATLDPGKRIDLYASCGTNSLVSQVALNPPGTTIASVTDSHHAVMSANATGGATNNGCAIYGTINDTPLDALDTAMAADPQCSGVLLPKGMMRIDRPHLRNVPLGCARSPIVVGKSVAGGGVQISGIGAGATRLNLTSSFAANMATNCNQGASANSCFVLQQNAHWRDLSIDGGGETLLGQTPGNFNLVEFGPSSIAENMTFANYGIRSSSPNYGYRATAGGVGDPATLINVIFDGFGTQLFHDSGAYTVFRGVSIVDYCGDHLIVSNGVIDFSGGFNLVIPGPCTGSGNAGIRINSGGAITGGGFLNVQGGNGDSNPFYGIINQGTLRMSNLTASGVNANSIGIFGQGGVTQISNSSLQGTAAVGLGAYFQNSVSTNQLIDGLGNTFNGGSSFIAGGLPPSHPGHAVNGTCTGTVPASVTIGFYGTGQNITTTACAATVGNGIIMQSSGTLQMLYATASAAGVGPDTVTVIKNGSATTITCNFGTTTTCSDGQHQVAYVAGDRISIQLLTAAADTLANPTATVAF